MFPWNFWSKGAGIIGCHNEASQNFMIDLTKEIKWPGKVFRAWKQGQYGFSTLMTMVLPPGSLDTFTKDDIVPLVLKQNGVEGPHSAPRFKAKPKGITIVTMGISPELAVGIRALGETEAHWER